MSGGPVFDETGLLVGILSKALQADDEPSPSYVSLLWPVLTATFLRCWPPILTTDNLSNWPPLNGVGEWTTLVDIDRRICAIDRPDVVSRSGDGTVTYRCWE